MAITESDVQKVAAAAALVPPARNVYLETDFVMNLVATVVDFQMHTTAVEKAFVHFRSQRWSEVRTMDDLEALLDRFPDDTEGNTELAEYLWGYKLWTRAHMLRGLGGFFAGLGVRDQPALHAWAARAQFERDFEGRVPGLGPAVFHGLLMRQGVETVKPDVHVRRFTEALLGRRLSDDDLVATVVAAARVLGVRAYELDWAIWEYQRALPP